MRKKNLIIYPVAAAQLSWTLAVPVLAQNAPTQNAPTPPVAPAVPVPNAPTPNPDLNAPAVPGTGPVTNPIVPATGIGPVSQPPLPPQPELPPSLADARNTASEQTPPLLLEEALVLALETSPLRAQARAALAAAQARVGTARSAGGLQANVGVNADIIHNGSALSGIGGGFGGGIGGTTIGGTTGGTTGGTVGGGTTGGTTGGTGTGIGTGGTGTGGTGGIGVGTGGTGGTTNPVQGGGTTASLIRRNQTTGTGGTGTGGTGTGGTTTPTAFSAPNRPFAHFVQLSGSLSYPLYTGGRVKASTRQAQYNALAQAAQTLQTESDVLLNTTNAYLSVLRAGQLLDVTESNLSVARERRRVAGVRYSAGAAARLEVLTADTTLADAIQRRIAAADSLAQSKATLNTYIGRTPEAPLRVEPIATLLPRIPAMIGTGTPVTGTATTGTATTGTTTTGTTPGTANAGIGLAGVGTDTTTTGAVPVTGTATTGTQAEALANLSSADLRARSDRERASLQAAQAQVQSAQAGLDLAKAQRKPSIGLSLTGLLSNPTSIISPIGALLGLNIAHTLFDSGRTRSQIAEAKAILDQQQNNLQQQRINLYNQIEQSLLAFDSAQKSVASADTAVASSQEAVRAAQLGYQAGVRTNLDVSDAQNNLLQAQTNSVNARFDAAIAQVLLASSVGVSSEAGQSAYLRALREEAERTLATQNLSTTKVSKKKRR